jgi:hypothetical protein
MWNRIRDAALGLAALALAAGLLPAPAKAGVLSNSGNFLFEVLSATYTGGSTIVVEAIPYGADGFLIQAAGGIGDLVPFGEDLLLTASVKAVNGSITDWTGELMNTLLGTMGEDIFDSSLSLLGSIILPDMGGSFYGEVSFASQTEILIIKDINGLAGAIGGVVQGIIVEVPVPAGFTILATGLVGLVAVRRRYAV